MAGSSAGPDHLRAALADADISVQGQEANNVWRGLFHLAQQLHMPIEVVFFVAA